MGKRVEKAGVPKVDWKALDVVHPDAAGIDIGGSEHWVAISPERDEQPVRCFECFTADLEQMARTANHSAGRTSSLSPSRWFLESARATNLE
jgi:hypothetical protein